jgi:alpha-ketoglutarate-dependent 2,4-dichlorophenoxyacetate dioxygenase
MPITIRQIGTLFVGEVSGIDTAKPVTPEHVAAIEAGMDKHAVLVFRDQKLTDEQQMAFTRNFGALEPARGGNITKPEDRRLDINMNDVTNLDKEHKRCRATAANACSTSPTCCGTRTARSGRSRPNTRCSRRAS